MVTQKWIGGSGQGLTYGALFGSEVNSLANLSSVRSSITVANGSPLDMFMDISVNLGSAAFTNGAGQKQQQVPLIAFYLYPLNQDGSTYGDGQFGSQTAAQPPGRYYSGAINLVIATQAQVGTLRGVVMPPGSFRMVLFNSGGATLNASSNSINYCTYNRSVV